MEPLRVGLLVDTFHQPRWVQRLVASIQASPYAEIVLVVQNTAAQPARQNGGSLLAKIVDQRDSLLYLLYRKLDERLFPVSPNAFEIVDLSEVLQGCPLLAVHPRQTTYSDYLNEQDYRAIRAYDLDVALRLGFRILRGEFLKIARYGVWSYHHGDNQVNRGGPPGFWEVMEGSPLTGSILQVLSEEMDGGQVIYRSTAATQRHSVHRNKNNYYWKTSDFVLRKLRDLYEQGLPGLDGAGRNGHRPQPYSHRLYRQPGNLEMLPLLWRWAVRYAGARLTNALYTYQWSLAYQINRPSGPTVSLYRSKPLTPPPDRFWADPFPVKLGDRYAIYIEEYLYREKKGHIAVIEMDSAGNWQAPRPVLEQDYHLSYPFVFQWEDELFMIPETAETGRIELYRCTFLPDKWELEQVVMEGVQAADTTLVQVGQTWWMFTSLAVEGSAKDDELYLFSAPSPLGPWAPHPRNPVKSDVRSSRSAGRIFNHQGCWYRPAQDCSETYGYAVVINEITRLDREGYEEREVSRILPRWQKGLVATHTFNQAGELVVLDALRLRRKLL